MKRILMVYIEPTPYISGLISKLREQYRGTIQVCYVTTNLTQDWKISIDGCADELLPKRQTSAKRRIKELLSSGAFDAVHLAGWGHPVLRATMMIAWRLGVPSLVESDTPRPPRQSVLKRVVKRIVYPWLFRLPAMFLPGGTRQSQYLQSFGVDEAKMRIAQMTVDVSAITRYVGAVDRRRRAEIREKYGFAGSEVIALYVGRLVPCKGINCLLNAFQQAVQRHSSLRLLVVGDGELRDNVRAAALSCRAVVPTGRLCGNDLLDVYAIADFLVVPSLSESWGLAINEAMAAGIPIIASDCVGCVDDLIPNNQTGFVVPADDSGSLCDAICRLASDNLKRTSLAENASRLIAGWTLEHEASIIISEWHRITRKAEPCFV
jgi:glycosyltransferase involved in cell wall biosynthesis